MTHTESSSACNLSFQVPGDLTSTNAQSVLQEIEALLDAPGGALAKLLVIDLKQARMVDSAGLNVLVAMLKRIQKLGGKMRILYTNQNIFRILVFTRLDQHVELVKS